MVECATQDDERHIASYTFHEEFQHGLEIRVLRS